MYGRTGALHPFEYCVGSRSLNIFTARSFSRPLLFRMHCLEEGNQVSPS